MNLHTWALKWHVSPEALRDLQMQLGTFTPPLAEDDPGVGKSEAWAQSAVRLEASQKGIYLFRNNSGALPDKSGRLVRFGLGNDSPQVNKILKSPDLVGWRAVKIATHHVGMVFGQTVLREMKEPGWQYTGDEHEKAQLAFINLGLSCGCDAAFATGVGTL